MVTVGTLAPVVAKELETCERERIDAPGRIQAHGWLLALSDDLTRLTHLSGNAPDWLGGVAPPCAVTDLPIRARGLVARIDGLLRTQDHPSAGPHALVTAPLDAAMGQVPTRLVVHRNATGVVAELRPEPAEEPSTTARHVAVLEDLRDTLARDEATPLRQLLQRVADGMRRATGFDRAMVYRLAPDGSGEVVAEARHRELEPFLGIRYPASDIPAQARRLYLRNRAREISDTAALPVPILPACGAEDAQPLDLSDSVLRAISPYHLEYMRNMRVRATFVLSIVLNGALWGLIALHHREPRILPWDVRAASAAVSEDLARRIDRDQTGRLERATRRGQLAADRFLSVSGGDPSGAWRGLLEDMMTTLNANGAMLVTATGCVTLGDAPPAGDGTALLRGLLAAGLEGPIAIDRVAEILGPDTPWPHNSAAGLAGWIGGGASPHLVCVVRGEEQRDVLWGGDPRAPVLRDAATGRLSPRGSFAIWRESVTGRSAAFGMEDVAWLTRLHAEVHAGGRDLPDIETVRAGLDTMLARSELWACRIGEAASGASVLARREPGTADMVVQDCSAAFQRLFDITREEARDLDLRGLSDLLGMDRRRPALGAGETIPECVVWSPRLGSRVLQGEWHGLFASTGPGGDGPVWATLTLRDMTETRRVEDALRATRDIADGQSRTKSEFLANMSHELRTPLNAILGYSEVLRDPGPIAMTEERRSSYAGNIHQAGSHLLQLIGDLLELSRMEAGQRKFHEEVVPLRAILEEARDWAVRNAGTGSDSAVISMAAPDLHVLADATAMRQILINLIGNALKFSPPGQAVQVAADRREDGSTVLTVTDRGPGIPMAQIERMFEPFRQGDSTLSKRHGGAGLGLAIVRALAERHGGSAHLNSAPGRGTEAVIILPPARALAIPVGPEG